MEKKIEDTGSEPVSVNGKSMYKMHPSGDIVDFEEMIKRRPLEPMDTSNLIFGYTHDEIAKKQGIKKLKK